MLPSMRFPAVVCRKPYPGPGVLPILGGHGPRWALEEQSEVPSLSELSGPFTYSSALGDGECPAGSFRLDMARRKMEWSDGLFLLHGYERGEVVPTFELILAHKHPDDRKRAQEILGEVLRVGGYFSIYHRLIDARGRVHQVLTAGEGILDESGRVSAVDGVMVDLTLTLRRETEKIARDAVAGATATRTVIDQARGILMGRLLIGSEQAFQLLVDYSSRRNLKVCVVSEELVQLADGPKASELLDPAIRALQAFALAPQRKPGRSHHPAAHPAAHPPAGRGGRVNAGPVSPG